MQKGVLTLGMYSYFKYLNYLCCVVSFVFYTNLVYSSEPTPSNKAIDNSPIANTEVNSEFFTGEWFEISLECTFCESISDQHITISGEDYLARFSDRMILSDDLLSGIIFAKTSSGSRSQHVLSTNVNFEKNRLILIEFNKTELPRNTDTYATVTVLNAVLGTRLLYGKRYTIKALSSIAFEVTNNESSSNIHFFPQERIIKLIDDIRVKTLSQSKQEFQAAEQIRISLDGVAAFARKSFSDVDIQNSIAFSIKEQTDKKSKIDLSLKMVRQGDTAYINGDYESALNSYKAANILSPQLPFVYANLGATYYVLSKLSEAEAALRMAIELDPVDMYSFFNLSLVLEQMNMKTEAIKQYRILLEISSRWRNQRAPCVTK